MLGTNEHELTERRACCLCSHVQGVLHSSHSGCIRRTPWKWMDGNPTACTHTFHAMFSIHVMSCAMVIHSVPKYRSREFGALWIASGSWDYSWCWHPEPCSWSSSTLSSAPTEGLAAKAHPTFLWALLKSLGVEVNDKVAVGVIKIQPWGRTHGKIISSISKQTHTGGWVPGLFGNCFMACLASCSGTTAFSGPSAGMIWCPTWMGDYYLCHFSGSYVRLVLQAFAVVSV